MNLEQFLAAHQRAYLFTKAADGTARGWPMAVYHRSSAIWCTTYGKSLKVEVLKECGRATVLIATDEGAIPIQYAVVEGPVSIRPITPDMVDDLMQARSGQEKSTPEKAAHYRARLAAGKRVLIEVAITSAEFFSVDGAAA